MGVSLLVAMSLLMLLLLDFCFARVVVRSVLLRLWILLVSEELLLDWDISIFQYPTNFLQTFAYVSMFGIVWVIGEF
jgi:hypothetical protein